MKLRLFHLLLVTPLMAACAEEQAEHQYDVDIRWTSHGIPHILAEDWGSIGYGFGYARATDGVCVYAKELATVNGTLSSDFEPTPYNVGSDIFYRSALTEERLALHRAAMPADAVAYNEGFRRGYNRYLKDNDGKLPASCNGESWVRPIEKGELDRMLVSVGLRYGLGRFAKEISAAAPPGEGVELASFDPYPEPDFGSNAVAVGSSLTASGRGLLLGNPHYPWHGPARFHMAHVTIPGVVDVMGVGLLATNFTVIGFNKDIAWTHTVSTATRFTLFELELNPENPMQYRRGDEYVDIARTTVEVPGAGPDGAALLHTVYSTHHGPIVRSEQLPWTTEKAYAVRDALADNNMGVISYFLMQTAKSVADIEKAISQQGVFFVNTIAADREGNAFYADISATPNIDAAMLERCQVGAGGRFIVLDGSDPSCDWVVDPRSKVPGNMPADDMPRATSTEYFTNSNDSYWLSNPDRPLEGYSPIIGDERAVRSLRTRAGLTFVNEIIDADRKFAPEDLKDMLYSHRHFGAELYLDDVLKVCESAADDISASCEVLANWDRTSNVDSVGTHIWTGFWEQARRTPNLFADEFDPDNPINTPSHLAIDNSEVAKALSAAMLQAQRRLEKSGIPLDAKWGDVQFAERNGEKIGIPGAVGSHGGFSYIVSDFTEGKGYTPIRHGNSYVQVVGWDEDGSLNARGILTYSQSPEPDSPYYSDQTKLYSKGEMIRFPFTEEEISADPNLRVVTLTE